ncbi:MAG TPA: hypothetical protein PLG47_00060 [Candidatus Dojkabacteria bacterium]|nr:hypothetical protein [Candidatus Dojkabacteria bacterium]
MDINGNLKTPCNIYGICGCKQSGKNTVAKIWQLLDFYYKMGKDYWVKSYTDTQYVLENLQFGNKKFSWEQKSYAHKLKQITCILLGCKIEDFENEEFKNSKLPEEWKVWKISYKYSSLTTWARETILVAKDELAAKLEFLKKNPNMYSEINAEEYLLTYREFLQFVGTELFRNQLHPDIWVNALFSDYHPKVVISSAYGNNYQEIPFDKNKKEHIDLWKGQQLRGLDNLGDNLPSWLITDVRFQNEANAVTERGGKLIKVIRYKVGDKVWFNDKAEPDKDKNQSGEYEIIGIHSNEEYLISNGTTEMGAWNCEINHINKDTHASEIEQDSIPVYYTIHNSTTLEDLIESVKYIMIEEGVIKV